jgi:hypothetical protein
MKDIEVEKINKHLIENYGRTDKNEARFRLVWSEELFEVRKGPFNIYYGSIFVRTINSPQQVRKYNYIRERWILEVSVPSQKQPLEVLHSDGYEPIYVFESADGQYLPPRLQVIKILMFNIMHPDSSFLERKDFYEKQDQKALRKEVEYFKDVMEDNSPYMAGMLKCGEAIVVPNVKKGD